MKILHLVGGYPIGTHPFVLWQVNGTLELGHSVAVLAANEGNTAGRALARELHLPDGICTYADARKYPLLTLNPRRFLPSVSRAANRARYGRLLAEQRKSFFSDLLTRPDLRDIDVVQSHFASWAIDVGLPLARLLQKPCVVTAHTAIDETPTDWLHHLQDEADAIVLVSDGDLRAFADRTGRSDKLHRVWNGVPLPACPPDRHRTTRRGRLRLVSAGRLDPAKRMLDVVDAVALLASNGIDCELSIFGEGAERDALEARIRNTGMIERIRLEGSVPHAQLMTELSAADLFLHASAVESFGMVMVEAMSAGLPVVAAASTGAREIVTNGETGLLFEVGDVTGLVAGVRLLAHDSTRRMTMGDAARQSVAERFSLEAHLRAMNSLWQALAAR